MASRKARARRMTAVEVEDEEYQLRYERVAGIDVAKASGVVCVRLPAKKPGGRRYSRTWTVEATVPAVSALAGQLLAEAVEMVSMESTSDYWRIWYYVLEACGLPVQLVNSSQARQLAGRPKTDEQDAQWIARLTEMGMLRPSFVPPPQIRELRDYTRARLHLVQDRTRVYQRLEKLLEGALVKVTSVTKVTAESVKAMIAAMADGERDPRALAGLARGPLRGKTDRLTAALDGMFDDHHGQIARAYLDQAAFLDRQVRALEDAAAACLEDNPASWGISADGVPGPAPGPDAAVLPAAARLDEIPGITGQQAIAIIAETGLDMSRFPTPARLVSWAGLAPVANQSGPRRRKGKKGQGDSYLRCLLTQAALGASGTASFLGERYSRVGRRRGKARAQVAVARSILIIIWHLLKDPQARYRDLGPDWYATAVSKDKIIRNCKRQLAALGLDVTLTPKAA
jgi:transposase